MSVLQELKRQRRLYARCPNCEEDFRLADASLFDATKPFPENAQKHLEELKNNLKEARQDFLKRQEHARSRPRITAESVGIGKVVEKIAPSLPGFPAHPADCRALLEPIDYLIFKGLATSGLVNAISFVELKSGKARLTRTQSQLRRLVENGCVDLVIAPRPKEGEP